MAGRPANTLADISAKAGDIVAGFQPLNRGLKLSLRTNHMPEVNKATRLEARFVVLEAGDGTYSEVFAPFVGKETNAEEVHLHAQNLGGKFKNMKYPLHTSNLRLQSQQDKQPNP